MKRADRLRKLVERRQEAVEIVVRFKSRRQAPEGAPGSAEARKALLKAVGDPARTKAARAAVEASRAPVVTRLATCERCGTQNAVPAADGSSAQCPSCGAGGL